MAVRWLRAGDGRCYGLEFWEATPACRASLLALARQVSLKGRVGKVPENGHPLQGEFDGLQELKPGDYRFMGFRHRENFFITNGAVKQSSASKQRPDYVFAKNLKEAFMRTVTK